MRPRSSTCVASTITSPTPDTANLPRCMRCQSVALPFSALYWHIGETTMRFASVNPRNVIGEKSPVDIDDLSPAGAGCCGSRCKSELMLQLAGDALRRAYCLADPRWRQRQPQRRAEQWPSIRGWRAYHETTCDCPLVRGHVGHAVDR